jgi:hypothetical protein
VSICFKEEKEVWLGVRDDGLELMRGFY